MSENIAQEIILEKDAFENTILESQQTIQDAVLPVGKQEVIVDPTLLEIIKKDRPDLVEIGNALDGIQINEALVQIANTNQLNMSWEQLQRILDSLINEQCTVMEDKFEDEGVKKLVETLSTNITHAINDHTNCPFTIQRLCELIIEPKKYYKMYIKYLRAVEKVLSVTSYWEDYANKSMASQEGVEPIVELMPSFSVQLVPHNFNDSNAFEEQEEASILPTAVAEEQDEIMQDEEGSNVTDKVKDVSDADKEQENKETDMEDVTKDPEETAKEETESERTSLESSKEEEVEANHANVKMDLD